MILAPVPTATGGSYIDKCVRAGVAMGVLVERLGVAYPPSPRVDTAVLFLGQAQGNSLRTIAWVAGHQHQSKQPQKQYFCIMTSCIVGFPV